MRVRRLGGIEASWSAFYDIAPINAVTYMKIKGHLRPTIVQKALNILQERHPMARVRIEKHQGNFYIYNDNVPTIPLSVHELNDLQDFRAIIEEEYDRPFNYTRGPLIRAALATFSKAPDTCYLLLNYMHTIGDGGSITNLFCELMLICAALKDKTAINLPVVETAPIAEERYPARVRSWKMKWKFVKFIIKQLKEDYWLGNTRIFDIKKNEYKHTRTRSLEKTIPANWVKQVNKIAKQHNTNIHGAACAAILMAQYEYYCKKYHTQKSVYMKNSSVLDLRSFLEPPIPANNFGSYVSFIASPHKMSVGMDFWQLAADIKRELKERIAKDDMFSVSIYAEPLAKLIVKLGQTIISALSVSNVGRLPLPTQFGSLQVLAYIGNVSNRGGGSNLSVILNTYNGKMYWSYTFPEPLISYQAVDSISNRAINIFLENAGISPN